MFDYFFYTLSKDENQRKLIFKSLGLSEEKFNALQHSSTNNMDAHSEIFDQTDNDSVPRLKRKDK